MGHSNWLNGGVSFERVNTSHAGPLHQSDPGRPNGYERNVRVSSLQKQIPWPDVRVDIQLENQREAIEMDFGRCCFVAASITFEAL